MHHFEATWEGNPTPALSPLFMVVNEPAGHAVIVLLFLSMLEVGFNGSTFRREFHVIHINILIKSVF